MIILKTLTINALIEKLEVDTDFHLEIKVTHGKADAFMQWRQKLQVSTLW